MIYILGYNTMYVLMQSGTGKDKRKWKNPKKVTLQNSISTFYNYIYFLFNILFFL